MNRLIKAFAVLVLLLSVLLFGTGVVSAATPTSSNWKIVSSQDPSSADNNLTGLAVVSGGDMWATGYYRNDDSSITNVLIEHWSGTQWSVIPGVNPGPNFNYLASVAAISSTNVWAVGFYASGIWKSLVEHWDGTSWKLVASPNPGSDSNVFNSVTAISAKSIWAVGYALNSSGSAHTLIEHWNGTSWNVISSPNVGSGSNFLAAVAHVPGAKTTWAVGNYYDVDSTTHTLVESNG